MIFQKCIVSAMIASTMAASPSALRGRELAEETKDIPCGELKGCYLYNLSTHEEKQLNASKSSSYCPTDSLKGWSVRCDTTLPLDSDDNEIPEAVKEIEYSYNGFTTTRISEPRWMKGTKESKSKCKELAIKPVKYLAKSGVKTFSVEGKQESKSCFSSTFTLEDSCSKTKDTSVLVKNPIDPVLLAPPVEPFKAQKWRIFTPKEKTLHQWKIDGPSLAFYESEDCSGEKLDTSAGVAFDSGNAGDMMYGPNNAFNVDDKIWGGRPDEHGNYYLGFDFVTADVSVNCIIVDQADATELTIQALRRGTTEWTDVWTETGVKVGVSTIPFTAPEPGVPVELPQSEKPPQMRSCARDGYNVFYQPSVPDNWYLEGENPSGEIKYVALTGDSPQSLSLSEERWWYAFSEHILPSHETRMRFVNDLGEAGPWQVCKKNSPIGLDLDESGAVERIRGEFVIDITGDGDLEYLNEWFAPTEGILIDVTHGIEGGVITGHHMFGDMGGSFSDGFAKLTLFDDNLDGFVSGEELEGFAVWTDANSNAKLDDGELSTLADHDIVGINTDHDTYVSTATRSDGSSMYIEDLWFAR